MNTSTRVAIFILSACVAEASARAVEVTTKGDFDEDAELDLSNATHGNETHHANGTAKAHHEGGNETHHANGTARHHHTIALDASPNNEDLMHVPYYWMKEKAKWGDQFKDGENYEAWSWRMCPDPDPNQKERHRCDQAFYVQVTFHVLEHGKACGFGMRWKGKSHTPETCARECYASYGCERFSVDALGGCKISIGEEHVLQRSPKKDMQCEPADVTGSEPDSKLYQLVFYHAAHVGVYCEANYELYVHAKTTAQCAHACKNRATCRSFSSGYTVVDGSNWYGCRLGNCSQNTGQARTRCDGQNAKCSMSDPMVSQKQSNSGFIYELNTAISIPEPN